MRSPQSIQGQDHDDEASFRFFSLQDIESARGVSSMATVDYDTDWQDSELEDEVDNYPAPEGTLPRSYDSTNNSYSEFFRDDNERELLSSEEQEAREDLDDYHSIWELKKRKRAEVSMHDKFFKRFPPSNINQRFYIAEEDLVVGIAGYETRWWSLWVYNVFCILTFGLLALLVRWFPKWRIGLMGRPVPLAKAQWVVVEDEFGVLEIQHVKRKWYNRNLSTYLQPKKLKDDTNDMDVGIDDVDPIVPVLIWFEYRYMKMFYDPLDDLYRLSNNWIDEKWCHYSDIKDGITEETFNVRSLIFGENMLNIKEKPVSQLLLDEVLHPFYVFQIFSILLWLADNYYYYAFCILIISLFSVIESLVETKSTMDRMRKMSIFECNLRVWRNGFWKEISSSELVPGDVYEVSDPSLTILPCDSILLNGDCIINESMLTGESVPVSKVPVSPDAVKDIEMEFNIPKFTPKFAKSFLYNGTKIVRVRYGIDEFGENEPATALVIRTGFNTTKGALVRSMLFPKPTGFKFYEDSFKYIGVMTCIACFGFIFSTINFIKLGLPTSVIILRALDLITIVVPPALPATLTIGTNLALHRLRKLNIFCIAPQRINVGGKIDIAVFDKTGTLTEEGLNVKGVHIPLQIKDRSAMGFSNLLEKNEEFANEMIMSSMVNCHSLKIVNDERVGDPLDENMFEFINWSMDEIDNVIKFKQGEVEWTQIEEFEFISNLRRMSVICKNNYEKDNYYIFVKGAPEIIKTLCSPESLPEDFEQLLHHYTHGGYRVIASASKVTNERLTERSDCETGLKFDGFIIFENKLKPLTRSSILALENANIKTVMCTGDNILTAVNVGRKCGMVDDDENVYMASMDNGYLEWMDVDDPSRKLDPLSLTPVGDIEKYSLAITGDIFKYIITEMSESGSMKQMLLKGSIFARMSPDEKHELVNQLRAIDHTVCFCGDGANDCGALKAADVGISLSEAEASVAAPFTSRVFEISCVLDVIKEGRASLVTSFSCFQYMSLYSAIQFITVSFLYKEGINLGDFEFLYIDLVLIIPLAVFMSWSGPSGGLDKKRPSANLVSPKILLPLMGDIIMLFLGQFLVWKVLKMYQGEDWYIPAIPGDDENVNSSDNTVLFFFTNFQYILIGLKLTKGEPYRMSVWKNRPFIITVIITISLSILLMMVPAGGSLGDRMSFTWVPEWIKFGVVILSVLNFFAMILMTPVFVKLASFWKKAESSKSYKRSEHLGTV